ncbi:CUE domain-containing protein 2-A [Exaiptasia diaphana]|nr:CUE domain-containing protein 2-A [Exaiptasia diaphana]
MLMSRDNDESCDPLVDSNPKPHHPSSKRLDINEHDHDKIKNNLVSRYGFVDVNSDSKTYQPSLLKKEEKKMIRYRDNLVVSTKGERFSMIKKQESEDERKTYVNLKPARKYRFH